MWRVHILRAAVTDGTGPKKVARHMNKSSPIGPADMFSGGFFSRSLSSCENYMCMECCVFCFGSEWRSNGKTWDNRWEARVRMNSLVPL